MLRIADTAGIRNTGDVIEKIGVERALLSAERADLILAVFDTSVPLSEEDEKIFEKIKGRRAIVLLNKSDLVPAFSAEDIRGKCEAPIIAISAKEETGMDELARVIRDWGEEKWAARIAGIICEQREKKPLTTTLDLVHAVDAAIPKAVRRKQDGHPARRTFQAIRIAVNDELAPLERAVRDFTDLLNPGGRICVITFHSLEDRIIKRCFKSLENPCICPPKAPVCTCGRKPVVRVLGGGAVAPTDEEIARNPRARSAKLRIAEKRAQG